MKAAPLQSEGFLYPAATGWPPNAAQYPSERTPSADLAGKDRVRVLPEVVTLRSLTDKSAG
jgi:hypothetical protein